MREAGRVGVSLNRRYNIVHRHSVTSRYPSASLPEVDRLGGRVTASSARLLYFEYMLRDAMWGVSARPTEADIRRIVETFYARVRVDPELGPIFEGRIGAGWDAHLDRMVDFWSGVLLATGRYRGNPLEKHASIPGLESHHYDRWLTLFEAVLSEVVDEHLARDIGARARRMRVVLDRTPHPAKAAGAGV